MNDHLGPLQKRLNELLEERKALGEEVFELRKEIRTIESRRFIEANNVTRGDIHFSDEAGSSCLDIGIFRGWLKKQHPRKQFCEWNTQIMFTEEVINGGPYFDSKGWISELPD